jgi:hypothetical protein
VKNKVLELYNDHSYVQKKKGCSSNNIREDAFTKKLEQYFYVAHQQVEEEILNDRLKNQRQKDEDIEFLEALQSEDMKIQLGTNNKLYEKY